MARKIQMLRGYEVDLPQLEVSELGFTVDTEKTFIGGATGNVELANQRDLAEVTQQLAETMYPSSDAIINNFEQLSTINSSWRGV